jgi:2-polyprenyl-3-methyl-5-hydroxy-6-metoxy-1,4-benzoquinol methylase
MTDWKSISQDPNAPAVLAARRRNLVSARKHYLIDDRCRYIAQQARGRKVLDVGVVEHFAQASRRDEWLHEHVRRAASTCLGVDILEDGVRELRQRGYNVVCADVAEAPLNEIFDLVVMGEVIEHVGNPGTLIKNAALMLAEGGRLLLTTPNPWYMNPILKNILEGQPFTDSADHVMWFDPSTIAEIGRRAGLALVCYAGIKMQHSGSALSKLAVRLAPAVISLGIRRELFAKAILYEFVRA